MSPDIVVSFIWQVVTPPLTTEAILLPGEEPLAKIWTVRLPLMWSMVMSQPETASEPRPVATVTPLQQKR